jgi:4-hydroxybenzoate polyprenyltransferase
MSLRTDTSPVTILSLDFVQAYVITMRPYLMFVSGITGLAGMAFLPSISAQGFILRFAASFLSYGFGQALTDCFQVDTDTLSSPYRPLTQGIISRVQTFLVSAVGLAFCIGVFTSGNSLNLLLGAAAGSGLATYTFFKRRWWGGPWYNAWIVVVLCSMAFLSGGRSFAELFTTPIAWTLGAVFFGYANFVLSGYFKDIEADRATNYRTLPVVAGRRISAYVSDLFAFLSITCAMSALSERVTSSLVADLASMVFLVSAIGVSMAAQLQLHQVTSDSDAHRAISPVVHSYILLLSSIISLRKPEWIGFLLLFYCAFSVVMKVRPAKNQI